MDKTPFEPVDPFDFERLYGDEKYSLQNMLLKQAGMPAYAYLGTDRIYDIWEDRNPVAWWEGVRKFLPGSRYTGDAFFAGVGDEPFLKWAAAVVSAVEGRPTAVTGAAVVRFTNAMSGYPALRLTAVETVIEPDRPRGLPTTKKKREPVRHFGGFGFPWEDGR